ncbi:MAG: hypothetical protein K0Q76_3822 [Panacagrimonas sp.]|jgi:hypothetical protein|nr:hypothetical protein [Panacagrimonas sp.]
MEAYRPRSSTALSPSPNFPFRTGLAGGKAGGWIWGLGGMRSDTMPTVNLPASV